MYKLYKTAYHVKVINSLIQSTPDSVNCLQFAHLVSSPFSLWHENVPLFIVTENTVGIPRCHYMSACDNQTDNSVSHFIHSRIVRVPTATSQFSKKNLQSVLIKFLRKKKLGPFLSQ